MAVQSAQETRFLREVGGTFPTQQYGEKFEPLFDLFIKYSQELSRRCEINPPTKYQHPPYFWEVAGKNWQSYVVRKSGWSTNKDLNYGGMESQAVYGEWQHRTAHIAAFCLKDKKWNFRQLESFCAFRREKIAEMLNAPNSTQYGQIKDTNQWTPCHSGYTYLRDKLFSLHQASKKEQTSFKTRSYYIPTEKTKNVDPSLLDQLKRENIPFECGAYFSDLNGKSVRLSEVLICRTHILHFSEERKYLFYDPEVDDSITVFHTKAKEKKIQKILAHTESIYNDAQKEENPDLFIEKLGKVFWWMCQCKPYLWGDPSIAETMIKAQAISKGFTVPPWKEELIPWEKVMEQPDVEKFAKDFHTFFDGKWMKGNG